MGFKDEKFPSSAAFDSIADVLKDESEKKQAIKQASGIYAFTLKNGSDEKSWHVDLKKAGTVGEGVAPAGEKATTTLILSDADFAKLASGQAQAQKLFMSGKLKLKGDMMKATKLEPLLKKAQSKAKL